MAPDLDLSDAARRQLVGELVPPDVIEPFGVYASASLDPTAELARHVERVVFLEAFGNTAELLAKEYGPYEAASLFLCVVDHRRQVPAGMMRVLVPSPAGFKSLVDIEPIWGLTVDALFSGAGLTHEPERTWDVATLAVGPEYRGKAASGLVSLALYQAVTMLARHRDVDWLVAIFDVPVLRMIRWKLRMTFAGFPGIGAASYLGSTASLPAWCRLSDAEERLGRTDPDLRALLFDGKGIEPAVRPIDLDGALGLVA